MKLLKDKRAEILRNILQEPEPEVVAKSSMKKRFEKARGALREMNQELENVVIEIDPSQWVTTHCTSPQERREASAAVVLQLIKDLEPIRISPLRDEFIKRTQGNFRLGISLSLTDFLLMELEAERISLSGIDFSLTEKGKEALRAKLDLIQLVFPEV